MRIKFDKMLGRLREKDSGSTTGTTTNTAEITRLINELTPLIVDERINSIVTQLLQDLYDLLNTQIIALGDQITADYLTHLNNIVDNFNQLFTELEAYNTNIQTRLTTIENYIGAINIGDTLTATIQNYIDTAVTQLINDVQVSIYNQLATELKEYIENNTTLDNSTRLISGTVNWIENLDFDVSPLVYKILGQLRQSPEKLVTIPANVSTDPMFAVIYADIFGNVGYILGAPAADPAIPLVNPSTQLLITPVLIPGLGTAPEPGTIATTVIYNENQEWTTSQTPDDFILIDFEADTDPAVDNLHIKIDTIAPSGGEYLTGKLSAAPVIAQKSFNIPAETNSFDFLLTELFAAHKTDSTSGTLRFLSWYNWSRLNSLDIVLTNTATAQTHRLKALNTFTPDTFTVAELGFSVAVPLNLVAITNSGTVPAGNYQMSIEGFTKYMQSYTTTVEISVGYAAAALKFTAEAPVYTKEGTLSMSLKGLTDCLENTGLLIELYNGAAKVGSLVLMLFGHQWGFNQLGRFYGFNPLFDGYQRITIPIADFAPTADVITAVQLRPVNQWPNLNTLLIDHIVLQTGLITNPQETPKIEDITFDYRDAILGSIYTLDPLASYGYKIIEAVILTDAGTATAQLYINAIPVIGVAPAMVTNTPQIFEATGANLAQENDILKLEIMAIDTATAITGKIRVIRT